MRKQSEPSVMQTSFSGVEKELKTYLYYYLIQIMTSHNLFMKTEIKSPKRFLKVNE